MSKKFFVPLAAASLLSFANISGAAASSNSFESALVMIEYQNEWVSDSGGLRNLLVEDDKHFQDSIERSKELLEFARNQGIRVVHVTLKPDPHYSVFGDASFGLRAAIPEAQTWRGEMQEIHKDFEPLPGEHVITERTGASAFSGSNLDSFLRNNSIDTLFLAGFATHVCVESTLREAHDKGYKTFAVTDATGAFNQQQQIYFEQEVLHHFGHGVKVAQLKKGATATSIKN